MKNITYFRILAWSLSSKFACKADSCLPSEETMTTGNCSRMMRNLWLCLRSFFFSWTQLNLCILKLAVASRIVLRLACDPWLPFPRFGDLAPATFSILLYWFLHRQAREQMPMASSPYKVHRDKLVWTCIGHAPSNSDDYGHYAPTIYWYLCRKQPSLAVSTFVFSKKTITFSHNFIDPAQAIWFKWQLMQQRHKWQLI